MKHILEVSDIREKRLLLGISQKKMAMVAGVSIQTYQRYEDKGDMWLSQCVRCTDYLNKVVDTDSEFIGKGR